MLMVTTTPFFTKTYNTKRSPFH